MCISLYNVSFVLCHVLCVIELLPHSCVRIDFNCLYFFFSQVEIYFDFIFDHWRCPFLAVSLSWLQIIRDASSNCHEPLFCGLTTISTLLSRVCALDFLCMLNTVYTYNFVRAYSDIVLFWDLLKSINVFSIILNFLIGCYANCLWNSRHIKIMFSKLSNVNTAYINFSLRKFQLTSCFV